MATKDIDTRITEAEDALHELEVGRGVVEIDPLGDGRKVKYQPAGIEALRGYIRRLYAEKNGVAQRGAITVHF